MKKKMETIIGKSQNRVALWEEFLNEFKCANVAELGVYKGAFAERILKECEQIKQYFMIDPWRNLTDWNKPANKDNQTFEGFFQETLLRTEFAKHKRHVLRGKTMEVIDQIQNESLDFVYIDGDHTLKGISIDLINTWNKVNPSGFVGGDDFSPTIWQHSEEFEPTMVFPFAVYFAEAMNVKIYALPFNQFLISKSDKGFEFIDLTNGLYKNTELLPQLKSSVKGKSSMKSRLAKRFGPLYRFYKNVIG